MLADDPSVSELELQELDKSLAQLKNSMRVLDRFGLTDIDGYVETKKPTKPLPVEKDKYSRQIKFIYPSVKLIRDSQTYIEIPTIEDNREFLSNYKIANKIYISGHLSDDIYDYWTANCFIINYGMEEIVAITKQFNKVVVYFNDGGKVFIKLGEFRTVKNKIEQSISLNNNRHII